MASSEMLRLVALVRTDISEELSGSIIRVTRLGKLGTQAYGHTAYHPKRRNSSSSLVSQLQLSLSVGGQQRMARAERLIQKSHPDL
jgi:hypothetical protein